MNLNKHCQNNLSEKKLIIRNFSEVKNMAEVDYDYVKRAVDNKSTIIIDVREPDEVKEHGSIPNSVHIPSKYRFQKVLLLSFC